MIVGSTPPTPGEDPRASGFPAPSPSRAPRRRAARAAPSQMPDALPAVTTPSFLKTGGSLPSDLDRRLRARSARRPRTGPVPFFDLDLDRDDLVLEEALLVRGRPALLARSAYSSLLARDAVLLGEVLGGDGHRRVGCSCRSARSRAIDLRRACRTRPSARRAATCGARLMFSVPPTRTTSVSPRRSCSAPFTIAWKPEPHRRFTVSAGVVREARLEADARAVDRVGLVCMTLPMMT